MSVQRHPYIEFTLHSSLSLIIIYLTLHVLQAEHTTLDTKNIYKQLEITVIWDTQATH
jgi:hypothetical protein